MKIRDRYTRGIGTTGQPLPARRREPDASAAVSAEPADRVQISGRGLEIRRARSLALAAPDIRQELVDEILGQIERGEYRVAGADVLPRMIREHWFLATGSLS